MESFSDGVFGFAITLLAVNLAMRLDALGDREGDGSGSQRWLMVGGGPVGGWFPGGLAARSVRRCCMAGVAWLQVPRAPGMR